LKKLSQGEVAKGVHLYISIRSIRGNVPDTCQLLHMRVRKFKFQHPIDLMEQYEFQIRTIRINWTGRAEYYQFLKCDSL